MKPTSNANNNPLFDYLFIGLGGANSLLILNLEIKNLLKGKKIAVIEPSDKFTDEKTFCFWSTHEELIDLNLDTLVSSSWRHIEIPGISKQNIQPLCYNHVKGSDLSDKIKAILSLNEVTYFRNSFVTTPKVSENYIEITIDDSQILCKTVYDSRPPNFIKAQNHQSSLYQSFYGWKIRTNKPAFDSASIVLMDFNIPQDNATQFVYTLPFEKDFALVEITRFGEDMLTEDTANSILQAYVQKFNSTFEIIEVEKGVIPMHSGEIEVNDFGANWINTGVRANLLKCSTGYAFHAMAEDALLQSEALNNECRAKRKSRKSRFSFYDRLLLKILSNSPLKGKSIFESLFKNVPIHHVLMFLREKTTLYDELFIFAKLPKRLFLKAAFMDLFHQVKQLPIILLPFIFTLFALFVSSLHLELIPWGILFIGFLSVGLAHGALDHLTSQKITNAKERVYFIIRYLTKSVLFGLVWLVSSDLSLSLFILFSAWHFGQADFKEWGLLPGKLSLLWGLVLLSMLFFFHMEELIEVLQQMPDLFIVDLLHKIPSDAFIWIQTLVITIGLILTWLTKSRHLLITLIYLFLANQLPLLMAFGIYFILQHSITGWKHLTIGLNTKTSLMQKNALPFTIGGAATFFIFLFFANQNHFGLTFIILSCLSLPHVLSMQHFYKHAHTN